MRFRIWNNGGMRWDRLSQAFDQFRKWSAFRTLLDILGVWKWVILGASVLGSGLLSYFSKLDPFVRVILVLLFIALVLAVSTFCVALWKANRPTEVQTTGKPKAYQIVLFVALLILAVVGAIWGPSKPQLNPGLE